MILRFSVGMEQKTAVIAYRFYENLRPVNNTELREIYMSGNMKIKLTKSKTYPDLTTEEVARERVIKKLFKHDPNYPIMPIEFVR